VIAFAGARWTADPHIQLMVTARGMKAEPCLGGVRGADEGGDPFVTFNDK
jgi:hypothetical protein